VAALTDGLGRVEVTTEETEVEETEVDDED
jgi:hypothetical protein